MNNIYTLFTWEGCSVCDDEPRPRHIFIYVEGKGSAAKKLFIRSMKVDFNKRTKCLEEYNIGRTFWRVEAVGDLKTISRPFRNCNDVPQESCAGHVTFDAFLQTAKHSTLYKETDGLIIKKSGEIIPPL